MPVPITQTGFWPPPPPVLAQQPTPFCPEPASPSKRLAAVPAYVAHNPAQGLVAQASTLLQCAFQPNSSAYPSQLRADNPGRHRAARAAKYSTSGSLQHSPPSKTAILALHRYTNDRPQRMPLPQSPRKRLTMFEHRF